MAMARNALIGFDMRLEIRWPPDVSWRFEEQRAPSAHHFLVDQSTDPGPEIEHTSASWADAPTDITTGTTDPFEAAWYLTKSRVWPLVSQAKVGPFVLGAILFCIVVAMVVLSPSTDSHFIYTDF